jgi:hypothetical protein
MQEGRKEDASRKDGREGSDLKAGRKEDESRKEDRKTGSCK